MPLDGYVEFVKYVWGEGGLLGCVVYTRDGRRLEYGAETAREALDATEDILEEFYHDEARSQEG